ncbi:hypothetical protein AMD00_04250 [Viridibacillus arvi]|uniref:Lipoprotein n=1 Tax=Viridibacillus arvi TaxID=263475 RepID=A0A0M0LNM3_9BACL|nr:hypothetical protein AMD00_04250 [Viridibacillus arvi]
MRRDYVKQGKFLLFIFTFFLFGCGLNNNTKDVMPEKMPSDFDFSVKFGVGKKNEIDTYEDKVTKDLVDDGTATINLPLSIEEKEKIYEKMKNINIIRLKELTPRTECMTKPYSEDEWKITINGEKITPYISGAYCEKANAENKLIDLRNYIRNIVQNKVEYQKLPEATGGYE